MTIDNRFRVLHDASIVFANIEGVYEQNSTKFLAKYKQLFFARNARISGKCTTHLRMIFSTLINLFLIITVLNKSFSGKGKHNVRLNSSGTPPP